MRLEDVRKTLRKFGDLVILEAKKELKTQGKDVTGILAIL